MDALAQSRVRVISDIPLGLHEIEGGEDDDLADNLEARYGGDPSGYRFRLIELPLGLFRARIAPSPEWYLDLDDPDDEGPARHRIVVGYRDAYAAPGPDPAPIVVVCEAGSWQILDGHHRASAAVAAGRSTIRAWELLGD